MVAGENHHVPRPLFLDDVDVAIDRVRGAFVPLADVAVMRRLDADELLQPAGQEVPPEPDVLLERTGPVLRKEIDPPQTGMDAIGKREVDDAIEAAEGDRGLGAVERERLEALALPAGENERERVLELVGEMGRRGHVSKIPTA